MSPVAAILIARRALGTRPRRTLVLLLGYALGVAVMIALLAVGDALLVQAQDRDLVAGGDLTLLPQGLDPDVLKVGAITGMFLSIPGARFFTRQVLLGPRYATDVLTVSPEITDKLVYLRVGDEVHAARASASLPEAARAARSALAVPGDGWQDHPEDAAWLQPRPETVLGEIDRFHTPMAGEAGRTWAEWWYFNFTEPGGAYGYLSFIADRERRVLVSVQVRLRDGRLVRWTETHTVTALPFGATDVAPAAGSGNPSSRSGSGLKYATGPHRVDLRDGVYHVHLAHSRLAADLAFRATPSLYFPPIESEAGDFRSGYVVPALRAAVSGTIRVRGQTFAITGTGYHDHNWGVWESDGSVVTWEWGTASTPRYALLAGLIRHPRLRSQEMLVTLFEAGAERRGLLSVLRGAPPELSDRRPGSRTPGRLRYRATNDAGDSLEVVVTAHDVLSTPAAENRFLQIRGRYVVDGVIAGKHVRFETDGFAETFVPVSLPR